MAKRTPKKGQGVPRETPTNNILADFQAALATAFPNDDWSSVADEMVERGYFEAAMGRQVEMLAAFAIEKAGAQGGELVHGLAESPAEKVRGVAAAVVPRLHADDLDAQLAGLRFTGSIAGTWPREQAQSELHNLILVHGVATIWARVADWIYDEDEAVQRMVAEAYRPRGVMLAHINELKDDPLPLRAILEPLLDDKSDYVRKAVANNLNDVSKDHPATVLAWAGEWLKPEPSKARRWIIERGLRTLVAAGNAEALALLGYAGPDQIGVVWHDTTPERVEINELIPFQFTLTNRTDSAVRALVLVVMDEPGKGKARRTSRYQIWKGTLPAGAAREVAKQVHFVDKNRQPKVGGVYHLTALVNGELVESREMVFER